MAKFIPANEVSSPRRRWTTIAVLDDPKQPKTCALALGKWDGEPKLAMRWNGSSDQPIGTPQSRGIPTWFIVPNRYYSALIGTLSHEMKALARNFFPDVK